jgi:hypothetical protein
MDRTISLPSKPPIESRYICSGTPTRPASCGCLLEASLCRVAVAACVSCSPSTPFQELAQACPWTRGLAPSVATRKRRPATQVRRHRLRRHRTNPSPLLNSPPLSICHFSVTRHFRARALPEYTVMLLDFMPRPPC